jgi:hypothetical protein
MSLYVAKKDEYNKEETAKEYNTTQGSKKANVSTLIINWK